MELNQTNRYIDCYDTVLIHDTYMWRGNWNKHTVK